MNQGQFIDGETKGWEEEKVNENNKRKIQEAGEKAIEFGQKGFHCSESVFMAVNDTLKIVDPSLVRLITGFHGGGGTHRLEKGVNMTEVLAGLASGKDRRPPEELPITQVGHLCGAIAAGIACIGLLYGRKEPTDDLTCVDELSYELHQRFKEEFGSQECLPVREKWKPLSPNYTCQLIYQRGAEIAVELILEAPHLVPECPPKIDF
jgi:C_GCAxxG_C_C family probable redox protein